MTPVNEVTETAPAKLTLSLRVLGRRPDGFHDLEALVVALCFGDTLEVRRVERPGVRLSVGGPASAGVPADGTNLVAKALEALGGGFDAALHKIVPAGAGLGGGSADAAAALRAGAHLLGRPADDPELPLLAARLGSDIPFCLRGGVAWMRGRGELIEPLHSLPPLSLVVAVPPFGLSTPEVYRAWDELGGPRSDRVCPAPAGLAGLLPGGLVNDLEPAALAVEPRLAGFRAALEEIAGVPAVLAGSGSAHFFLSATSAAAGAAAEVTSKLSGSRAFVSGLAG